MKKTSPLILRHSLLFFATIFAFCSLQATAQTKLASPRISQAVSEANLVPMHAKVHPLARPEFDRGVVADSQPMNRMLLVLQRSPEQETALRNLMDEQQTKNSPNYHAWLTPQQFGQQFGVADADIQKVTGWLAQKGFTGIKVAPGNMFVEFSGTAGLVRNAFHTEMHNFMVKGESHMANVSVPQIPAALAPVLAGIHSLHNFRKKSFMHYSQALAAAKAEGKLKPGFGTGTGLFAVGPGDFAKIYNLPPTSGAGALDGTGQTIAIVARSNIAVSDINQFGSATTGFNIPSLANFTAANNIILASSDPGIVPGDDGEATLDVEWSGAVAPNATIKLVVSDGTATTFADGVDLSAIYIVENNLAQIMNESFGACEAAANDGFENAIWEEAASQGITVTVSSGDNGSAACDPQSDPNAATFGLAVSGTASTPFNVAVGGTDFDDAANPTTFWNNTAALETAKSYIPEIPWNDTCASGATIGLVTGFCATVDQKGLDLVGAGGGPSTCGIQDASFNCLSGYPKPIWQTGTGVPADGVRDIPDVSFFAAVNSASSHFYIICLADSALQNGQPCNLTGPALNFSGVGGTSASSPAFAGIIALVNQSEVTAGRLKAGEGQGNVNYVLYKLAAAQATSPGTANCNSNGATPPAAGCVFNDVTKGNNSVACDVAQVGTAQCSAGTNATGILVEAPVPPYTANAPAWSATAGYDLATGLGSVNVTKLAGSWGTVTSNFAGDTTAITTPAAGSVNITHGATVNFTASVTQNTGTVKPTGDVSLTATPTTGPQVNVSGGTLANGTVPLPTNFLPGGTYPVVAHYAGDGTFAASDSAPFTVTVAKENSTAQTVLVQLDPTTGNPTTVTTAPYGSGYLLRTDVFGTQNGDTASCANNPIPCPTGTITFTDNGAPLKDFLNTGGGAANPTTNTAALNVFGFVEDRELASTGLIGGPHSVGTSYSGDISYNASAAPTLAFTITPASTGTGVTANGAATATVSTGQSVTLVATVTGFNLINGVPLVSNGVGPTGTVTFSTCGTPPCTATVVPVSFNTVTGAAASGTATLATSFSTTGVKTISATYASGDLNYSGSASSGAGNATVTVNAAGTFTVASTPVTLNSSTGASVNSTITVTSVSGFNSAVTVACPTSLPPGVTCTAPAAITPPANGSANGMVTLAVTATSTTLTASNLREDRKQEAKAIPPTIGGKGWWALSAGTGFAALFLLFLPGGRKKYRAALGLGLACILSFTLGCSGNGSTPPPTKTATVTKLTVTSGKVASGTNFSFSVAVTGGTPAGMVQLFDNATAIGTPVAVSGGTAAPTATGLTVGTHSISAHYLGDTTTLASASGSLNLTVTGGTTIAITTSPAATPAAAAISVTIN